MSRSKIANALASKHLYETTKSQPKEHQTVLEFLDRLQIDAKITCADKPDIFASLGNDDFLIGIEITQLCADDNNKGSKERERHASWKKIAEVLRSRLLSKEEPLSKIYGSIFFKNNNGRLSPLPCKQHEIDKFCEQILLVLCSTEISEHGQEIRDFSIDHIPMLANLVEHLYVRRFPDKENFFWHCADLQSGDVADAQNVIIEIIKKKKKKSLNYDWKDAPERWLLIYAAGHGLMDLACYLEGPSIADPNPFTQIFVWDKFTETIYRLSPTISAVFEDGNKLYLKNIPPNVISYLRS